MTEKQYNRLCCILIEFIIKYAEHDDLRKFEKSSLLADVTNAFYRFFGFYGFASKSDKIIDALVNFVFEASTDDTMTLEEKGKVYSDIVPAISNVLHIM